jgi:cell wall-associated NlpC family hydrolase
MNLHAKQGIIGLLTVLMLSASGCGPNTTKQQAATPPNVNVIGGHGPSSDGGVSILNASQEPGSLPIMKHNGVSYVAGNDLANILQLNTNWDASRGVYQLGDFDAAYELKVDSTEALVDEDKVLLKEAPILYNSLVYIPVTALDELFKEYTSFVITEQEVRVNAAVDTVTGSINDPEEPNTGAELDFVDDPDDPFKGEEPAPEHTNDAEAAMAPIFNEKNRLSAMMFPSNPPEAVPAALKNININGMIAKAKRYLGVKYLFGAPPYPKSNKFDCSTYTRYIFGRYGINLARTARAQALKGTAVSRSKLRKGDLLFFYVPGRFRTNKTVGHVAMYIGNSRMIHASPEPENGVQITNINKNYWKQTFVKAKRIAY